MRKIDPSKLEPNFNSTDELGQLQLHQALTWYSQNKVAKDAILYSISQYYITCNHPTFSVCISFTGQYVA